MPPPDKAKINRKPTDKWTTREKLALASAVVHCGDNNWASVSRIIKPYGDNNRPSDWFSQRNTALQYSALIDDLDAPKRKRGAAESNTKDSQANVICRKLRQDRIDELQQYIQEFQKSYPKQVEEITKIESGELDDKLKDMWEQCQETMKAEEDDRLAKEKDLKEREARIAAPGRKFRDVVVAPVHSPLSIKVEDISIQVPSTTNQTSVSHTIETPIVSIPTPACATSPLLTSLLNSPIAKEPIVLSSMASSPISPRQSFFTPTSILVGSPVVVKTEDILSTPKTTTISKTDTVCTPSISSPISLSSSLTLSKLLEMPPSISDCLPLILTTPLLQEPTTELEAETIIADIKLEFPVEEPAPVPAPEPIKIEDKVGSPDSNETEPLAAPVDVPSELVKEEETLTTNSQSFIKEEPESSLDTPEKTLESSPVSGDLTSDSSDSTIKYSNVEPPIESPKLEPIEDEPVNESQEPPVEEVLSKEDSDESNKMEEKTSLSPESSNDASTIEMDVPTTKEIDKLVDFEIPKPSPTAEDTSNIAKPAKVAQPSSTPKRRGRPPKNPDMKKEEIIENKKEEEAKKSLIDSLPNSPSYSEDAEREYKTWKKSIMLVWNSAANHKFANTFLHPVTEEVAPGYSSVVHKPMDLSVIKKNIENGVIRTTEEFEKDIMIMFLNAIMYNSSDHDVYKMSLVMQSEVLDHIKDFRATQLMLQATDTKVLRGRKTDEELFLSGKKSKKVSHEDGLQSKKRRPRQE